MELRQLRYFIQTSEDLNFTLAAKSLFISQSTLSQQIKQLEIELGSPLFDRIGKRISLTEAGSQFLVYAKAALNNASAGLLALQDLNEIKTGSLSIGITYALRTLLTPTLLAFTKRYPGVKVNIKFGTSEELTNLLQTSKLDFIMTFQENYDQKLLERRFLFASPLALIIPKGHPLASGKTVTLPEVAKLRLAVPVKGYSTRDYIEKVMQMQQLHSNIQVEINDIPTLLELVRSGQFATILTMATVEGATELSAIPIKARNMSRQAFLIRLKEAYETKAAAKFSQMLLEMTNKTLHVEK